MFALSLICYILCSAPLFVVSSSPCQLDTLKRGIMDKITAFVDALDLPASPAQHLTSKLAGDSNLSAFLNGHHHSESLLLSLACYSAQACLGADSVDTKPANQTEVDANWSVVLVLKTARN